jgi:16S rRNA (uracil1498-N3)-methyltransferase
VSAPWIHVQTLPHAGGGSVAISADEARHAAGSRRLRGGDAVTLFDGQGTVAAAHLVVGTATAVQAQFSVVERRTPATPRIEIASAIPKGDRVATLLESIAPLAVAAWTPLECRHSVVRCSPPLVQRAQRVLIAACKQSRQPFVPQIAPACSVAECCDDARRRSLQVFLAHPSVAADELPPAVFGDGVLVLIGPEGGFSAEEIGEAESRGARRMSLGASILRIELAASCAAALWRLSPQRK